MEKLKEGEKAGIYHAENFDGSDNCPNCGRELAEPGYFCEACGKKIVDKSQGQIMLEIEEENNGR